MSKHCVEIYAGEHMGATIVSTNPSPRWPRSTIGGIQGGGGNAIDELRSALRTPMDGRCRKFRIIIEQIEE